MCICVISERNRCFEQEQFEGCLPEFYSERLINLQGPLTAGISGVTFQNQMALPFPDHTSTCYSVDTYISAWIYPPTHSSSVTISINSNCRYQYADLRLSFNFLLTQKSTEIATDSSESSSVCWLCIKEWHVWYRCEKSLLRQSPPDHPGRHSAQYWPLIKKSSCGPHVPLLHRLQFSNMLQPLTRGENSQKERSWCLTVQCLKNYKVMW